MKKNHNCLSTYAFCVVAIAVMASLASCKPQNKSAENAMPVKIADYLWEYTADKYYAYAEIPQSRIDGVGSEFGCSAVRNGNFYGRNLDFFISETSEIIVHIPAAEGRHASIGVASIQGVTDEQIVNGLTDEQIMAMPWGTFDGINDAGLFCNMNVVPYEDGGDNPGTNPGKPRLCNAMLVRALLDSCGSVDEAIEFINNHDLYGQKLGDFNLHFMIGDPSRNVVVEFINNEAVVAEKYIMTNFYVNLPELTPNADGVERYAILTENYAEGGESMEGMYNLLKRVRFSQAYDANVKPFWTTEWLMNQYRWDEDETVILADPKVQYDLALYKHFMETGQYNREDGLWWTTHNSIYDISEKKLWITIREQYGQKPHEFKL